MCLTGAVQLPAEPTTAIRYKVVLSPAKDAELPPSQRLYYPEFMCGDMAYRIGQIAVADYFRDRHEWLHVIKTLKGARLYAKVSQRYWTTSPLHPHSQVGKECRAVILKVLCTVPGNEGIQWSYSGESLAALPEEDHDRMHALECETWRQIIPIKEVR